MLRRSEIYGLQHRAGAVGARLGGAADGEHRLVVAGGAQAVSRGWHRRQGRPSIADSVVAPRLGEDAMAVAAEIFAAESDQLVADGCRRQTALGLGAARRHLSSRGS